ncbi:MAG: multifunctional CCA addition/repair protein [Magnetococcus sp. DMHC-6]
MQFYQVGGCVRDGLLGRTWRDRDWVVVGGTAQELCLLGFKSVGRGFPVFLHPKTGEAYAMARQESKVGRGYRGFEVFSGPEVTLRDDLYRRDLTINAMAIDEQGRLIDFFGGQEDLQHRLLRPVSQAFAEDPLRVLRVARFWAELYPFGFQLAPEMRAEIVKITQSGELDDLTPERVWMETIKGLATPKPSLFFSLLEQCGALAVVFPQLHALIGKSQPLHYHPEGDAWVHTLMVLDQAAILSSDLRVRFAALVHDLGKGETPMSELPRHIGHEKRGGEGVIAFGRRLRISHEFIKLGVIVAQEHLRCHRVLAMRPAQIVRLLEALGAFEQSDFFELALLACQSDAQGRGSAQNIYYPQADFLRECRYLCAEIKGGDFLAQGLRGPDIGEAVRLARIGRVRSVLKESPFKLLVPKKKEGVWGSHPPGFDL